MLRISRIGINLTHLQILDQLVSVYDVRLAVMIPISSQISSGGKNNYHLHIQIQQRIGMTHTGC